MSEDITTYMKEIITRMDFIGHVPPTKKLCIKIKSYVDPEIWSTRPYRWYQGEDSSLTCEYIKKTVDALSEILIKQLKPDAKIRPVLVDKASIFREGIVNLIETYSDNPDASSKLRTQLSMLDLILPENKKIVNHNTAMEEYVTSGEQETPIDEESEPMSSSPGTSPIFSKKKNKKKN